MILSEHTNEVFALETTLANLCVAWKTLLYTMKSFFFFILESLGEDRQHATTFSEGIVHLTWFNLDTMKGRSVLQNFGQVMLKTNIFLFTGYLLTLIPYQIHVKNPSYQQSTLHA